MVAARAEMLALDPTSKYIACFLLQRQPNSTGAPPTMTMAPVLCSNARTSIPAPCRVHLQGPLHNGGKPSEEWTGWRDKMRLQARDERAERKDLRKTNPRW